MKNRRPFSFAMSVFVAVLAGASPAAGSSASGVGNIPQGTQSDAVYAGSFASHGVTNTFVTTQHISCYRPEVSATQFNNAPDDGYSGESDCPGATTTEDTGAAGPYTTQVGSNTGYPMGGPQLVKDYSESDIRVDPSNPMHVIGSSKWIVSPEGYNHVLGFYESFDGGKSWPVMGHIPGYEGWTDNTDPVGAFDTFGNYYELILPYQFFYGADGSHNFSINPQQEPNPVQPAEVISIAVHPTTNTGANTAANWITTHNGHPDIVAAYDSRGNEPDKQWLTIDTNARSPHKNRIYAMWVDFHGPFTSIPWVSFADAKADGTHTDWSPPQQLPFFNGDHPSGGTYLLPHVTPDGTVWTTVTTTEPSKGFCCDNIILDKSTDGGVTWTAVSRVADAITPPPLFYHNTTFRDGIENTFAVGNHLDSKGFYPIYVSWEDFSSGSDNVIITASFDGGLSWPVRFQVNDNANPNIDEFQPNLAVAADGTVSVNFYDRRLACPAQGTAEADAAGIAHDTLNPRYSGTLPPYGVSNYCLNASVQFYKPELTPIGNNIRLTEHTWDGELNGPHPANAFNNGYTFIGDYFGNAFSGSIDMATFVSTYNDVTKPSNEQNPGNRQQQVVATVAIP
jgi:hypothetical protein